VLSQRSWHLNDVGALGSSAERDELLARGVLAVDVQGRLVSTGRPLPDVSPSHDDRLVVAVALGALSADRAPEGWAGPSPLRDPWALARASELFASAGDPDRAEAAALRGLGALTDAAARADFWGRWEATLAAFSSGSEAMPRLRRSAELA